MCSSSDASSSLASPLLLSISFHSFPLSLLPFIMISLPLSPSSSSYSSSSMCVYVRVCVSFDFTFFAQGILDRTRVSHVYVYPLPFSRSGLVKTVCRQAFPRLQASKGATFVLNLVCAVERVSLEDRGSCEKGRRKSFTQCKHSQTNSQHRASDQITQTARKCTPRRESTLTHITTSLSHPSTPVRCSLHQHRQPV